MASRTVIGPLSTTFTPPPACSTRLAGCTFGCSKAYLAQACLPAATQAPFVSGATTCWPPASPGAPAPSGRYSGWGFYSPGRICPAGHTSACSAVGGGVQGWPFQFPLVSGETAVGCCPSGLSCTLYTTDSTFTAQMCIAVATNTEVEIATCSAGNTVGPNEWLLPTVQSSVDPARSTFSLFNLTALSILAPLIDIRWQASDLPSTSTPTGTTISPTPSPTSIATSTVPPSDFPTGAKIAIGVIVPIAALAAFAGAVLCFQRKRRARGYENVASGLVDLPPPLHTAPPSQPIESPGVHASDAKAELSASEHARYELDAVRPTQEMDGRKSVPRRAHELE